MNSITWGTFVNMETSEIVSLHPVVVGAVVRVATIGPLLNGEIPRVRRERDLVGSLVCPLRRPCIWCRESDPPKLTFGVWGHFGFGSFTSEIPSVYAQSDGGFKSLLTEERKNPYAVARSWHGRGFDISMGSRFHW